MYNDAFAPRDVQTQTLLTQKNIEHMEEQDDLNAEALDFWHRHRTSSTHELEMLKFQAELKYYCPQCTHCEKYCIRYGPNKWT